ncbi:hypothetical protein [Streptomyces sp. TBY4]|uniref:hypothetical protein n=1 Tax=Streptomyces sp. TBY4 TaxID=2962030 RepID=UPI0020B68582|nr:hypothetical protein [Streptomyces sp. TBY4]MCP3760633.1 hypothetical protein [Streptomyces sp. TBY4]
MPLAAAHRARARRASLKDVNAIVRLLANDSMPPEQAVITREHQPELRLALAHFGLEAGEVWIAETNSGVLEAAAVWIPPNAAIDEEQYTALLRLHGFGALATVSSRRHDGPMQPREEHWLLAAFGAAATADLTAADAVLMPVLRAADHARLPAYACAPASYRAEALRPFGFVSWTSESLPDSAGWLHRAPTPR